MYCLACSTSGDSSCKSSSETTVRHGKAARLFVRSILNAEYHFRAVSATWRTGEDSSRLARRPGRSSFPGDRPLRSATLSGCGSDCHGSQSSSTGSVFCYYFGNCSSSTKPLLALAQHPGISSSVRDQAFASAAVELQANGAFFIVYQELIAFDACHANTLKRRATSIQLIPSRFRARSPLKVSKSLNGQRAIDARVDTSSGIHRQSGPSTSAWHDARC